MQKNTNKKVKSLPGNEKSTLGHETAQINTTLIIPLKGFKKDVLNELRSLMHVQVCYLINALEYGGASSTDDSIDTAISVYLEAQCKQHYLVNNIE